MGQILTHVLDQILTHGASTEFDTQYCISNGSATFRPRFLGQKLTQNLGQVLTTKTKGCYAGDGEYKFGPFDQVKKSVGCARCAARTADCASAARKARRPSLASGVCTPKHPRPGHPQIDGAVPPPDAGGAWQPTA